jgi:2-polyprenyl-3-methyl-5-hydroxy-6-metoxy-1,4-benzoquinol methylase
MSNAASATSFFDQHAKRWTSLYAKKASFRDRLALFVDAVTRAIPAGGRVLDLGCGAGNISLALAERGYRVLGADGAPEMVREALAEAEKRGLKNAEFVEADITTLAMEPDSFDAVVCSSVIEYVQNDAALLLEMRRLLRPSGRLILSVPHRGSLAGMAEDVIWRSRMGGKREGRRHLGYSLRRYGREEVLRTLKAMGFGSFRCRYFELPVPGALGVWLSRASLLGVMMLVEATRR